MRPRPLPAAIAASEKQDFWRCVDAHAGVDQCWPWRGPSLDRKYGSFRIAPFGYFPAHRVAYWLATGKQPPVERQVGHRCNNKGCVNPAHLYLCTPKKNAEDAARDGLYPTGDGHWTHLHPEWVSYDTAPKNPASGDAWHAAHDGKMVGNPMPVRAGAPVNLLTGDAWHAAHDGTLPTGADWKRLHPDTSKQGAGGLRNGTHTHPESVLRGAAWYAAHPRARRSAS